MDFMAESVGYNTQPFPKKSTETGRIIKMGNRTDCALIELIDNWGYTLSMYRPSNAIVKTFPFNSVRKRMITIIRNNSGVGLRVFVKGAS